MGLSGNNNHNSHGAIELEVVEGATFGYYTLRLDTEPRKIQRQTGAQQQKRFVSHCLCLRSYLLKQERFSCPPGTNPNLPVHGNGRCDYENYADTTRKGPTIRYEFGNSFISFIVDL